MADPVLSSVLVELIASAIGNAVGTTYQLAGASRRRVTIQAHLRADPAISATLEQAATRLAEVERIDARLGGERLRAFLASTECRRALVPLFYATRLDEPSLATLREGFRALLAHATGISPADAATHGDRLFDALAIAARRALQVTMTDRGLVALDASAHLRHLVLRDELANVERKIALLAQASFPSAEAIADYVREYRRQVAHREGAIMPPHLDGQVRRPLDDVYVRPTLLRRTGERTERGAYVPFLSAIERTVVLGNPGGGKTTLTKRLAVDVSSAPEVDGCVPRTAIRIVLRDYGPAKRQQPGWSLLRQIEATAASRYQLPDPPPGTFEHVLRNGLAFVLLDGLDELLDTAQRREISADIESFAHLFPTAPMLVTSRQVGYDQAPLDPRSFVVYELAEFTPVEVRRYAAKAFSLDSPMPVRVDDQIVTTFMTESAAVEDLRSNPLLLGLMCNLYRGQGYIPANRPDIYDKCAVMLFERWDRSRGIDQPLSFESRLRPAMRHLAHWIFTSDGARAGVTEAQLIRTAAAYLHGRSSDDPDEARAAAIAFVELCKGRAWVFTDTGTTADGEPLFQFTHRTFLEYFTAAYLVATNATPEQLAEAILVRAARREWDTVLHLAAQMQTRSLEDAADVLLERLLTAELSQEEHANVVAFVRESLQYLLPSPGLIRRIVREAVAEVHDDVRNEAPMGDVIPITTLLGAGTETRALVRETLVSELAAVAETNPDEPALVGLALHALPRRGPTYWIRAGRELQEHLRPLLLEIAETDMVIAQDLVERGMLSAPAFAERFGTEPLFEHRPFPHLNQVSRVSLMVNVVVDLATRPPSEHDLLLVRSIAQALRESPLPWVSWKALDGAVYELLEARHEHGRLTREPHPSECWDEDARFLAFAVIAALHDALPRAQRDDSPGSTFALADEEEDEEERFWWRYNAWAQTPLGAVERLVMDPESEDDPQQLFGPRDAAFAQRWLDGSISLTY